MTRCRMTPAINIRTVTMSREISVTVQITTETQSTQSFLTETSLDSANNKQCHAGYGLFSVIQTKYKDLCALSATAPCVA